MNPYTQSKAEPQSKPRPKASHDLEQTFARLRSTKVKNPHQFDPFLGVEDRRDR
jgi:hypothetical protein